MQADPRLKYSIVGFLDDDSTHHGSRFGGVTVYGRPEDVSDLPVLWAPSTR